MKNFNYRVGEQEIILSPEEHQKVGQSVQNGKPNVFLRDGRVMINMSFVKSVVETDKQTTEEEKESQARLRLDTAQREATGSPDYMKKVHNAFYEKNGWSHGEKCACKSWVLTG